MIPLSEWERISVSSFRHFQKKTAWFKCLFCCLHVFPSASKLEYSECGMNKAVISFVFSFFFFSAPPLCFNNMLTDHYVLQNLLQSRILCVPLNLGYSMILWTITNIYIYVYVHIYVMVFIYITIINEHMSVDWCFHT